MAEFLEPGTAKYDTGRCAKCKTPLGEGDAMYASIKRGPFCETCGQAINDERRLDMDFGIPEEAPNG